MKNAGPYLVVFAGALIGLAVSSAQQTGAQQKKLPDGSSLEERTGKNRVRLENAHFSGQRIAAYLDNPAAGAISPQAGRGGEVVRRPSRPDGMKEFNGPFGAQWLTNNGLPAIGPPWSELVAYDLNQGAIKWRIPAGNNAAPAEKGIAATGSYRPRNRPVTTAGGVDFHRNRRQLRALHANPDGIPAVYEAAATAGSGSRTPMNIKPGKPEAQGYHAFALPKRGPVSKK